MRRDCFRPKPANSKLIRSANPKLIHLKTSSTIRSQPFTMFRFLKPELPKLPSSRTSSLGFHRLYEIPSAKISTPAMIHFPKFFPKQFHRKFFPGLSPKSFRQAQRLNGWRFPKMLHRIFRPVPASNPNLLQPTLKNRNCAGL